MGTPPPENIHPEFHRMLDRRNKEALLRQRGCVIWLYGLSGSGKSTLAQALEAQLHGEGFLTRILDGDNIRSGLNSNLGFSDEDRLENIRRIAEVAKLFCHAGIVTLASFITPRRELRALARGIVGGGDFIEVYVRCSFESCEQRDVKGLYARAKAGEIPQFTGRDSSFEEPESCELTLDTENETIEQSLARLHEAVLPRIRPQENPPAGA